MPCYGIYQTGTPYNVGDVSTLNFAQVADVTYFAHYYYPPWKLIRYGHTDWEWVQVTFGPTVSAPTGVAGTATNPNQDAANSGNAYFPEPATYVVTAYDEGTGQESRASTSSVTLTNDLTLKRNYNTITWTGLPDYPTTGGWSSASGGYYRVYKADQTGLFGYIGATTQTSFVDDNIDADLSSGPPTGYNPFPGAGDYPAVVKFHEQRSWWGQTLNNPNALYASRSADYENMDYRSPGQEDDSLIIGLVSDKVNVINQLASTKQGLLALTTNCVFSVQGANDNYITATPPPQAIVEITRGVSALLPLQIDSILLYQTVKTGEIRALGYEFAIDGLRTDDVTIFSRHLFDNHTIVDWCWVEKPHSAIIAVRDDGIIVALTWDQAQQVWGWTEWRTSGSYLKVCAITEQGEDRIYVVVARATGILVERFTSDLWTSPSDACYLDAAKTYYSSPQGSPTTFERLEHLNGQRVYAWVDGALYSADQNGNPFIVTNGQVTLPVSGYTVHIGLGFTAEIETLPLAMETRAGWNIGRPQEANEAVVKIIDTRGLWVGPSFNNLIEVKQRKYASMGYPTELATGNLNVNLQGLSGDEITLCIQSDIGTPMHIVGVLLDPSFGDKS